MTANIPIFRIYVINNGGAKQTQCIYTDNTSMIVSGLVKESVQAMMVEQLMSPETLQL